MFTHHFDHRFSIKWGKQVLYLLPVLLEPGRQLQATAQVLDGLILVEAGSVGGDLKEDTTR